MFLYAFVTLFVAAILNENGVANANCPKDYNPIAGKCYSFYQTPSTWTGAQGICEEYGAQLASVKSQQEYTALLDHINAYYGGQYWLSGSLVGGNWVWTTDNSEMKPDWFGRTPRTSGNFCAYFCSFTKKYWDGDCSTQKKFICQTNEIQDTVEQEIEVHIDPRLQGGDSEISTNQRNNL